MDKTTSIKMETERLLRLAVSSDYVPTIMTYISDSVVEDVNECADPVDWNEDDVRLAIGRVLVDILKGENNAVD